MAKLNKLSRKIILSCLLLAGASFSQASPKSSGNIFIFSNPSAKKIDWSSPKKLLSSTAGSEAAVMAGNLFGGDRETALGHIVIHYTCTDEDGTPHRGWTGMTGQNDPAVDKKDLLDDQIGFGLLFKNYPDGALVSDEISFKQVAEHPGRLEVNGVFPEVVHPQFFRASVTAKQCGVIAGYVAEFRRRSYTGSEPLEHWAQRPLSERLFYGNPIKEPWSNYQKIQAGHLETPLGGGCTAFGTSFLKLAGRWDPLFEKLWLRTLMISERLIGGLPGPDGAPTQVPVTDILVSPVGWNWHVSGYPDRKMQMYDPEMMRDFFQGVRSCASGSSPGAQGCTEAIQKWIKAMGARLHPDETVTLSTSSGKTVIRTGIGLD